MISLRQGFDKLSLTGLRQDLADKTTKESCHSELVEELSSTVFIFTAYGLIWNSIYNSPNDA